MAHKKGMGSSQNGRESESKRLGVKIYGGQHAKAGNIIVRQRGTKHYPGTNVGMGKDNTLFALIDGTVVFRKKQKNRSYVSIDPVEVVAEVAEKVAPVKKAPAAKPVTEEKEVKVEVKEEPKKAEAEPEKKEVNAEADDLKKLDGVGPKLAEILNEAGINTYADLAGISVEKIKEILESAGSRYASKDPEPWIAQAKELTK